MGTDYIRWVPEHPVSHMWQRKNGRGLTRNIDEALQFKTKLECELWIKNYSPKLFASEHMFVGNRLL